MIQITYLTGIQKLSQEVSNFSEWSSTSNKFVVSSNKQSYTWSHQAPVCYSFHSCLGGGMNITEDFVLNKIEILFEYLGMQSSPLLL